MKRLLIGALLCCVSGPLLAATDGAQKYAQTCADCHGRKADRAAFGKAPPLISLTREQFVAALTDRRDGKIPTRGGEERAKKSLTDDDIQGLADYVRSLQPASGAVAN